MGLLTSIPPKFEPLNRRPLTFAEKLASIYPVEPEPSVIVIGVHQERLKVVWSLKTWEPEVAAIDLQRFEAGKFRR